MRRAPHVLLALALAAGALLGGCQSAGRTVEMPAAMPPLADMVLPPSFLTPRSQRYRIAVRSFVDHTGRAGALTDVAGEVLATALDARDRFELYDVRVGPAAATMPGAAPSEGRHGEDYRALQGVVDGVLESYVTGIAMDEKGAGHFEVDYRVVDPYSRMVVTSGTGRVGVRAGAIVRKDIALLAGGISRPFIDPDVLAQYDVEVREVSLDESDVKLTLSGGSIQQIEKGFVGFVIEQDHHTRVERYLAKFVVVNVFPEAAIGVLVEHCNAVDRCEAGKGIVPVEQAQNIHVGSRVRFK